MGLSGLPDRLASPGAAIGLALLVLAWAERNRALLLPTLAYLAAMLVPITAASVQHDPPWYSLPLFFQGSMLLLGAIGFALAQRPLRSPAM
jgi:predicted membrane channel-forming protein YqfA (hemolysin III family)